MSYSPLRAPNDPEESGLSDAGKEPLPCDLSLVREFGGKAFAYRSVRKLEGLAHLREIETLKLSFNMIRKIENLDTLTRLTTLELYDNQIKKIEGLEALVNLEVLELSCNQIRKIEGLESLLNLEHLKLQINQITEIQNLDHLNNLTFLDLRENKLTVNHNELAEWSSMVNLSANKELKYLNVAGNPIVKRAPYEYKYRLMAIVPSLRNVLADDDTSVCEYYKID
ncbi:unnamed protein product [Ceutorhynchus assimilis]|uniref:Dynein axonemal assembly factor 1 homolog n=1 Tax=Ceutorhynchus assimilis TaxID=467358 RepID=A0A9N9MEZ8_9CUCU|nr:unnamed protein product [Ceutorhynchus assimilis]